MDCFNSEISQNKRMEKISQVLKKQKNLTIINQNVAKSGYLILAKDEIGNEYTIKSSSICDGFDSVCDQKLDAAIQEAKILSDCNHPNILKYVTSFQIETNYFIQMQKRKYSLQDFVDNKHNESLDKQQFIEFALQILYSIQYLHEKNNVLRDISLKNILLDDNKSNCVTLDYQCKSTLLKKHKNSSYHKQKEFSSIFLLKSQNYQRKQIIKHKIIKHLKEMYGNLGFACISLLVLHSIMFYNLHKKSINSEINQILLNILKRTPNQRPTIKQMIDQFNQVRINKEEEQQELMNQAQKQFDSFDFNSSIGLLQKLIEMNPVNDQYLAMLGQAYLEIKKIDESIDSNLALNNLGFCYFRKRDIQKSLSFINKSLEINSNNFMALTCMGFIRDTQKQYDEAIELCKKSLLINPSFDKAYFVLGLVHIHLNKYDFSIEYYKKALQINPNFELAHNIGYIYQIQKQYDLSIEYYKTAIQINPNLEQADNNLGYIYQIQKKYDLSIECYKKALQIKPNFEQAHHNLGYFYQHKKEYDLSIQYYKKALQINPNFEITHKHLGIIYQIQNKYDLSMQCFKKALKIKPNNELTKNRIISLQKLI